MIVKIVLDILENSFGDIFVLDNNVIAHDKKWGYLRTIVSLKPRDVDGVVRLLKRNTHRSVSTDWIEYMDYDVNRNLKDLNREHHYKYYERSRDLDKEDDDFYYVSVFLDNHDWEQFVDFKIPKSEIEWSVLDNWLGRIC